MNTAVLIIIVLAAIFAIVETVIIFSGIPDSECSYGFTALIVMNKYDDVEMKLKSIVNKLKWTENELIEKIVIVNNGLSTLQMEICRQYCRENDFLEIAEPDEIINLIISSKKIT